MANYPSVAAIVALPVAIQSQFGINGSITGVLINQVRPDQSAEVERYRNEDTNPDTVIFHERGMTLTIDGDKKNRSADFASAHIGAQFDLNAISFFTEPMSEGFPVTSGGGFTAGYFFVSDRDSTITRGRLDAFSVTLEYWGWTMPRHPA